MKRNKHKLKKNRNRISLCMIVKNEEEHIGRCLESIHRFVDEIIIIDTGSTDKTIDIAKKYGAKLYYHPWENDFSKHRNQAILYATGNWILQVDADEELFPEDGHKLKSSVNSGKADYYYCTFYDIGDDNSVKSIYNIVRLFRKVPGIRYTGKIHEQIAKHGHGEFSDIRFRHYGYYLDNQRMQLKLQQRIEMLNEAISDRPDEPYNYFQLAATYGFLRDSAKALTFGEIALDLASRKNLLADYVLNLYYLVADNYIKQGEYDRAESICLRAINIFPLSFDIHYLLTSLYFKEKKWNLCKEYGIKALEVLKKILNKPSMLGGAYLINLRNSYRIHLMLGYIYCIDENLENAEKHFSQAWEESEQSIEVAEEICHIYSSFGFTSALTPWLEYIWERREESQSPIIHKNPDFCITLAKKYLDGNFIQKSEECLKLIEEKKLTKFQCISLLFLKVMIAWRKGDIPEMFSQLSPLLNRAELATNLMINSTDDVGKVFFQLGEYFCRTKMWHEAKEAIKIGIAISPHLFVKERFMDILSEHLL